MVVYDIDDTHCLCGHKWVRVNSSLKFSDYYYCERCDKIYRPTVIEDTKEWFKENYNFDKRTELINYAKLIKAKKKVTDKDLIKLGYLTKE